MTEVHANLSPNRETQRMLRHRSAVMTLARMRAKRAVLLALRAQGLKPQDFSAREIAVLSDYYLNQHRAKLMAEAAEAIASWNTRQTRTAQLQEKSPMADVATNYGKPNTPTPSGQCGRQTKGVSDREGGGAIDRGST
jgi:hypothetical protein